MGTLALPPWLVLGLTVSVFTLALWKGGREERLVAAALIAGWIATLALRDRTWSDPQWAGFVIDLLLLAVLVAVALRTDRYWPLFAAGFHLLAVVTHTARMVDPVLDDWAYITGIVIFSYLVLVALAIGSWGAWRRRREGLAP